MTYHYGRVVSLLILPRDLPRDFKYLVIYRHECDMPHINCESAT